MKHFTLPNSNKKRVANYDPEFRDTLWTYLKNGRLFTLLIFISLTNLDLLQAQTPLCPITTPIVSDSTRTLPTTCDASDTFVGLSGNVWEFTIDNAKGYTFKICYDGDGATTAQADLFDDLAGTLIASTGSADADRCVSVAYTADGSTPCTSADGTVYLAIYSHTCLPDWEDWNIEVSCTCCAITCAPDVHVAATQNTCEAGAFSIPVPTVTGPCDETMVMYTVLPADFGLTGADAAAINPQAGSGFDIGSITSVSVPAGVDVGVYTLTWTASDCTGDTYTCEQRVYVEPVMVCNDNVNVTLGASCWVDITADMILEAPCTEDHQYTVTIVGDDDNRIESPGTYTVQVTYTPTVDGMDGSALDMNNPSFGIYCWGEITVSDLTGPTCTVPLADRQYVLYCGDSIATTTPTFNDCTSLGDTTMIDTELGDCSMYEMESFADAQDTDDGGNGFIDAFEPDYQIPVPDADLLPSFGFDIERVIIRTWQISDGLGNSVTSCEQFIYILRPDDIRDPVSPISVECNTATTTASLAGIDPQYVPNYANPAYDNDSRPGRSRMDGFPVTDSDDDGDPQFLALADSHTACKYSVTYTDIPLEDLCGNTSKFIREWTVIDWCDGEIEVNSFAQIIKTVDTTAPTFASCPSATDQGGSASNPIVLNTSSSNDGACYHVGLLNRPSASDTCGDVTYSAIVYDTLGTFVINVPDLTTMVQLNMGCYRVEFTATDDCGNTAVCNTFYCVTDDDKPVAICEDQTIVALSNSVSGITQVCASNIDNGSYDNCGVSAIRIKRMTDGEAVPFTDCIDINCDDSSFMVILRVYDAVGNYNDCMSEVVVQDKIGPFITCPPNATIDCTQDYRDLTITGNVRDGLSATNAIDGYAWDNCVLDSITYTDSGTLDCGAGTITRTWTAHSNGSTSSCDQTIVVTAVNSFTVQFPADQTVSTCISPDNLGDLGAPIITNDVCAQIGISTVDQRFEVVEGACYKIFRTFTVINWCIYDNQSTTNTPSGNVVSESTNTYSDDGDGYFRYTQVIKVTDTVAPTFTTCSSDTLSFMTSAVGATASVSIDGSATDACYATLSYGFSLDLNDDGTIDSVGTASTLDASVLAGLHRVIFTAEDGCGNASTCTQYFNVTESDNSRAAVAGHITNEFGEDVEKVEVHLSSDDGDWNPSMTESTGDFYFNDLPMHSNYTIDPNKDINPTNGISTYDLVLISQHILDVEKLDSPYKIIAADVNNNGTITTADIVELRQMILHIITDFQNNTSWRFVDASYVFPNPNNPFSEAFPEFRTLNDLETDEMKMDFVGVKVGDVNGSAIANSLLGETERNTNGTVSFLAKDRLIALGETVNIPIQVKDVATLNGFQMGLSFDTKTLSFTGIESTKLVGFGEQNLGTTFLDEGIVTISWNTAQATNLAEEDIVFTLQFEATATVQLSEAIAITNRHLSAEAYDDELNIFDVDLHFDTTNGIVSNDATFELLQNEPNPFRGTTTIRFNLPEASTATLTIFDMAGQVMKVEKGTFDGGYNEWFINTDNMASGILYYQLETPTHAAIKKMLLID